MGCSAVVTMVMTMVKWEHEDQKHACWRIQGEVPESDGSGASAPRVIITKRGKLVAKLVPIEESRDPIFGFLKGKVKNQGRHRRAYSRARRVGRSGVILLDTHVLIWLISDFEKLSGPARREIQKARKMGEGLAISSVSLLEVASLYCKNRISLEMPLQAFLQNIEEAFTVLTITSRACARSVELPAHYPRDPADRIIGATALVNGLTLITADRSILAAQSARTMW